MMEKVTLQFKTIDDLWHFKKEIRSQELEINERELSIYCECEEDEIQLAVTKYGATLRERTGSQK